MVELLVRCVCGHILDIKESYGRLGEVVIRVENCWNCTDIARDKGYEEGAKDGFAQYKEDKKEEENG